VKSEVVKKLADLGLSIEQIVAVLEVIEAETKPVKEAEEIRKEKGRERWHRWHEKHASNVCQRLPNVSQRLPNDSRGGATRVSDNLSRLELSGEGNNNKQSLGAFAPEREFFAEFWLVYPRREGANPKKPAKAVFDRLVARGIPPQRLIDGAQELAREHPAPTRFVPQAVTWLNQERFGDGDAVLSGDEFCPDDWRYTRPLMIRFKEERKHDPPRAVQGGKAGFLIPAEWVVSLRARTAEQEQKHA
jgi:hypothetical protein